MRLVVAVTGATGAPLAVAVLRTLRHMGVHTHLIISRWARATIEQECHESVRDVSALADIVHHPDDHYAPIASGSFRTDGMIIVPCSMRTLAAIATGTGPGLIHRAADVTLKEGRPLTLVPREMPLHAIHLENMLRVRRAGAVVMPPVMGFYHQPASIRDLIDHLVYRILDQHGLSVPEAQRWKGRSEAIPNNTNHAGQMTQSDSELIKED
ncbi:UbiX family flavin prenyltransferase [Nocardia terpenica]|uniref:UbiX family flavin prenyltransferase n=1 Tax=Nocardia terpenica TaxID=455432 RepID=UPI00189396AD|nr:UbiX family flavin prenyltransferase [Nocardia terpenica]MBF6065367.1 UbiX family flavin prenyltransferase [Nocardia terpenica]MBF6108939.1 UbiX family flavin prenyltransferase [Nocardia terpenica]MBF6121782.1 UbiX family flavin prenyltransferase [Nocardia terpenica]